MVNTERSICANCRGGKLAQAAKDSQRDTLHNTLRYTITMQHSRQPENK